MRLVGRSLGLLVRLLAGWLVSWLAGRSLGRGVDLLAGWSVSWPVGRPLGLVGIVSRPIDFCRLI